MNNAELIKSFLDNVVTGDTEAARASFSLYCNSKAKSIGKTERINEHLAQLNAAILEYDVSADHNSVSGNAQAEAPLRMDGDKILVNNKMVGRIQYDMDDWDGGINFVSDDGSFSKEFNTADDLFAFLSKKFLGEG